MKYFFILGSNPALSLAELSALLPAEIKNAELVSDQALVVESAKLDLGEMIRRVGGVVKAGEVLLELGSQDDLLAAVKKILKPGTKKFRFGFSSYGRPINIKPLAMSVKTILKESGVSCRWVVSREPVLSSVVVEQNGLIDDGAEIVFLSHQGKVYVAQTRAVQLFKELSARDYGRPARDDRSGMLPPKLAQILINLSQIHDRGALVCDPFCGSGTILTEAMLLGFKNLFGSDISDKAVNDTRKNISWTKENYPETGDAKIELVRQSATELKNNLQPRSVAAFVTEPYLGPQRGGFDTYKMVGELESLYGEFLQSCQGLLRAHGRAVMIWPVFRARQGNIMLSKSIAGSFKIICPLPKHFFGEKIRLTNRQTIIYGRPEQKVWREIVILEN